jgi:hypothetical protein
MGGNLNVVLVKLADRVHNMRTLGAMPAEKRAKKAKETMELFVPLAKTVGVAPIEAELRRLSAQHLSPLAELSAAATASELQASRPNSWTSLVRGFVDESFAKAQCPALLAEFLLADRALREADLGGKLVAHRQAWAAHCAAADTPHFSSSRSSSSSSSSSSSASSSSASAASASSAARKRQQQPRSFPPAGASRRGLFGVGAGGAGAAREASSNLRAAYATALVAGFANAPAAFGHETIDALATLFTQ